MSGGIFGVVNDALFGAQPDSPDFNKIAQDQLKANRPDQSTPFGSLNWTKDANGNWTQQSQFGPQLQGAASSLMGQWGQNAAAGYGTGDDARRQSIDASWGQFQRMNDPLFAQQQNKSRSDLLNMGADMGDPIYQQQMNNLSDQQGKMYLNAQDQAVAAGDRAQGQTFNQNRTAWMDPLNALGAMQGLLQMPGVPQSNDLMQGAQNQFNADQSQYAQQMANFESLLNGATSVAGAVGAMPAAAAPAAAAPASLGFAYGGASPYSPGKLRAPDFTSLG